MRKQPCLEDKINPAGPKRSRVWGLRLRVWGLGFGVEGAYLWYEQRPAILVSAGPWLPKPDLCMICNTHTHTQIQPETPQFLAHATIVGYEASEAMRCDIQTPACWLQRCYHARLGTGTRVHRPAMNTWGSASSHGAPNPGGLDADTCERLPAVRSNTCRCWCPRAPPLCFSRS
jgi:hypothetical protein